MTCGIVHDIRPVLHDTKCAVYIYALHASEIQKTRKNKMIQYKTTNLLILHDKSIEVQRT